MTNSPRQKFLVPVDYSAGSCRAVELAIRLAVPLEASLHVLHVWELMPHPPKDMRVQTADGQSRLLTELIQSNAEADMQRFLAGVKFPAGVTATHSIESGEPSRRIVEAAKEGGFDMIVMGAEGGGALAQFMLGSIAERVLRHAVVPVVMVPRPREGEPQ